MSPTEYDIEGRTVIITAALAARTELRKAPSRISRQADETMRLITSPR